MHWGKPPEPARQRGQSIALFALLLMFAFIGFLALAIDLGLLYGQRRFDQNGADAAVLAASQYLASNVVPAAATPDPDTGMFPVAFFVTDQEVYAKVRQYVNSNQSVSLTGRTAVSATLEYSADGVNWCYSPSGPPAPDSTIPVCALYDENGSGPIYPPPPIAWTSSNPTGSPCYVRVIVRSTTDSFFAQMITGGSLGQGAASCAPSPSPKGMLTCAEAGGLVTGSATYQGTAPLLPVVTPDCMGGVLGQTYNLWEPNVSGCSFQGGSWKDVTDLSDESVWCQASPAGRGYPYCSGGAPVGSWNRSGFVADSSHPGSGALLGDLQWWIANSFQGKVQAGDQLPTGIPSFRGDGGNNVSSAFYGPGSATTGGTFFFAPNQPGFYAICPDDYGIANGWSCRDASIILWENAEKNSGTNWTPSGQNPERITVARILTFRLYCSPSGPGSCGDLGSNSTILGRCVGPYNPPPVICKTCGPSLNGNSASLGN